MIALLLACTQDKAVTAIDLGSIIADRADESAEVSAAAAYGYNDRGAALVFLTGNPEASCELVAEYLSTSGVWDTSQIMKAGSCQFYATLKYDGAPVEIKDDLLSAFPGFGCAMDEGEWVAEDDYLYSGPYWQGSPDGFSLGLSGGNGKEYELSLEMYNYTGNFIYENMDAAPATGAVVGTMPLQWCADLDQATIFQNML